MIFKQGLQYLQAENGLTRDRRFLPRGVHIHDRAMQQLAAVSAQDRIAIATTLDEVYFELNGYGPDERAEVESRLSETYDWFELYDIMQGHFGYSFVSLFFLFKEDFVKAGWLGADQFKWEDYFAVAALGLLGRAAERVAKDQGRGELHDAALATEMPPLCMEAMEAITYAEHFGVIRYGRRLAAHKRHDGTKMLEAEFINYFRKHASLSRREAARRFYQSLPPDKKALLVESNAVRTLTDALRRAERSEAESPDV